MSAGMARVVSAFAATRDFIEARRLQQQIIEAYESDFGKHAPARIVERMRLVWKSLPGQLAKENKKFIYGALRPGARARDFEESLQWLMDYGIVHKVPRVSALRAPLSSYEDLSGFKLFCIDTGILGALSNLPPTIVLDGSAVFTEFKGSLTEQYVAQELLLQGKKPRVLVLYLWQCPKPILLSITWGLYFRLRSRRRRTLKRRV